MPDTQFLSRERQALIRESLAETGRVNAGALARRFGVSEDTVRRDLRDLAAAGLCERVYGGALAVPVQSLPLSARLTLEPARKAALAEAAAGCISAGMSVFFDAGSTNLAIARALPQDIALQVATNAPVIAAALSEHPRIDVVMIGGRIERGVGGAIDAHAMHEAGTLLPDLMVLGACGLDRRAGVTASTFDDATFKRFVAGRSRAVLAAVTTEKIGAPQPYVVMPLSPSLSIVVEADAADEDVAAIAASGAAVVHAGRAPETPTPAMAS